MAVLLSTLSANAFTSVSVFQQRQQQKHLATRKSVTAVSALIYGWDGEQSEHDTSSSSSYLDVGSGMGESCSPVGTAVAEALSFDSDKAGHLARLAVAFSPPERALALDRIERVDVICVREDSIEIEAIICEDGGCVSLSVPVKFPKDCHSSETAAMEGCVVQNLYELDGEAGSLLKIAEQTRATEAESAESFDELCVLNEQVNNFPSWWVPPECDATLAMDCENIRTLLNDPEFQSDVNALSQDALRKLDDGEDYKVLQAKVAIVGPAGMCFKVRAQYEPASDRRIHILDVVHPFGETMRNTEDLRAAVLGAVSAAEGA